MFSKVTRWPVRARQKPSACFHVSRCGEKERQRPPTYRRSPGQEAAGGSWTSPESKVVWKMRLWVSFVQTERSRVEIKQSKCERDILLCGKASFRDRLHTASEQIEVFFRFRSSFTYLSLTIMHISELASHTFSCALFNSIENTQYKRKARPAD